MVVVVVCGPSLCERNNLVKLCSAGFLDFDLYCSSSFFTKLKIEKKYNLSTPCSRNKSKWEDTVVVKKSPKVQKLQSRALNPILRTPAVKMLLPAQKLVTELEKVAPLSPKVAPDS